MNTQFRYYTSFPAFIKDTGNSVCVSRNFWLKHFKKPGKIVTLFADKGFWQYSATPSNKCILSPLTFRNSLEILLWSCRSRFYKETYVYNYNSLDGEIPLPAYVPLNGPPLNVWVTSPFWFRYPNHSPCLGSENCKQREKLFSNKSHKMFRGLVMWYARNLRCFQVSTCKGN